MLHFAYFLEEFRGIPPREPPISGTRVTTYWAGERPTRHCQVRICTPFPAVSLFVLLSFLLPVRALLCGRLPHTFRIRRGRRAAGNTSPPCQMRFVGRWRHLHQGGGCTHHARCAHAEFWSDMGVSSLVIVLLRRWGSGVELT